MDDSEKAGTITLALAGDVMLGRLVNQALRTVEVGYPWGNFLPLLRQADLTLVNLECAIAQTGKPWTRTPKVFHFRADPKAVDVLRVAGVDFVSLANNHILDFEEEALGETIGLLRSNGFAVAGAGFNLDEAMRPAMLKGGGLQVGMVAFTDNMPEWAATETQPGVFYLPITTEPRVLDRLRRTIGVARSTGANLVIVSAHWGPNMRERPSMQFRHFAHSVLDAGADIFYGHSAHIIQGVEIYKEKPILYDTGDFVDDYAVDPILRNDETMLFLLEVSARGVHRIRMIPGLIENCQINRAIGPSFRQIVRRMERLSSELGSKVERTGEGLELTILPNIDKAW